MNSDLKIKNILQIIFSNRFRNKKIPAGDVFYVIVQTSEKFKKKHNYQSKFHHTDLFSFPITQKQVSLLPRMRWFLYIGKTDLGLATRLKDHKKSIVHEPYSICVKNYNF